MKIQVILEPDLSVDEIRELGLLAESLGIHGLWVQNYSSAMDPFMSLVPLARASQRLQLGVVIVSPQEMHPLKLATSVLTLNELSGGRAAAVLGRGGDWIGQIGGDFRPIVAALEDALHIVRMAARGEGRTRPMNFEGTYFKARQFRSAWAQATPDAVVYAGVTLDRMLRMAAGAADGVMLADLGLPRVAAERIGVLENALRAIDRPRANIRVNNFVGWHAKADPDETYREARRELIIRAWLAPWWLRQFLDDDEAAFIANHRQVFIDANRNRSGTIDGVPDELIKKLLDGLTITAPLANFDHAIQRVQEFAAAGVDELALRLHDRPDESIRLIGERVVPALS